MQTPYAHPVRAVAYSGRAGTVISALISANSAAGPTIRKLHMSKGLERKKEQKKKPAKTLAEKRAAKQEKKAKR
jgi:hypothetical protein